MKKLFILLSALTIINPKAKCQDDYFLYWDFNDKKEVPNRNVEISEEWEENKGEEKKKPKEENKVENVSNLEGIVDEYWHCSF